MNKNTLRLINLGNRVVRCFTLLMLLLTISLGAKANPVDRGRARQIASNFLNAYGVRSAELTDVSAEAGFSNVYVFSSENGFVLLAADDRVQPILGYSFTQKFDLDNMPDNKRAWIQGYSDEIQAAIDCRSVATAEVAQQWRDLAEGNPSRQNRAVVVEPLVQTQWDQDEPFNNLCPAGTVTGCVATAMAQIMKFHNYPSHGMGSHSYNWNGQTLSADFQNTNYNWANMINSYAYGAGTTAQKQAVATLMYHCGVSVEMNYGSASSGGSSASTYNVVYALKTYFNYSNDIQYLSRSAYSENDWIAMLKADLDLGRPLQYRGSSDGGGGHSFICDGYRDDNYFHFNWGWSGYCDDFYTVNNLNPGPNGIGSGYNGIYNDNQAAIFHIHPSECVAAEPTNLTRTVNGRNVTLNWNAATGAVSYNIYRNGSLVDNATTNTYTHTNAPYGEGTYYVRSVDANGYLSLTSNTVSVTIDYPTPVVNDLAAIASGRNVNLTWTAPEWCYPTTPTATLSYGGTHNAIMGVGIPMYWGHRYLAANLNDYNNMKVYKVSFYAVETGEYRVHVYQGTTSNNRPQTEVLQQTFTAGNTGWFDIDLTNTVDIDATQDLWVFIFDPLNREYPASFCTNNIDPEGGYISVEGYGGPTGFVQAYNNRNFNIRTYISDGNYTYNLYRNGSSIANNLDATSYNDNNLADGTYNYTVRTNYHGGLAGASNTATVTISSTMHEITATANPSAGGTVSGAGSFAPGSSCTLTATANTGYNFVNWTKNGTQVSTNPSYTFTVTEAGAYVANFEAITYTITATANPAAGGTVTGGGTYNHGESCTLTATANTGYIFNQWFKNGSPVSGDAAYTFTVTEAGDYVAHFIDPSSICDIVFELNDSYGDGWNGNKLMVTANGASHELTFDDGYSATHTLTFATGTHVELSWITGNDVNECSFTVSYSYGAEIYASSGTPLSSLSFAFDVDCTVPTCTITATANPTAGGTVSGAGTYDAGESCTLTATPATGYTFVNWTKGGSVVSTNASYTFTVTEAGAYVANFQINTYDITASANPTAGGTVSGAGTFNHGQSCTLTATAATGYTFVNWTKGGSVVSTNAAYTFTVTEAGAYVANFQINTYDITASANPMAGGTVSGAGTFNHGQSCTLTATAATGYTFVNWTKGGSVVSTNASYTFTVTEAGAYVANFQINTYDITATANPTAGGTVSGAGTFNHGQSCTLTATAATGYNFVNWTKGGTEVSTNATYTFTVTEAGAYVANFQAVSYAITATANPAAGGTVTGAGTYNHGASCTLTATAATDYSFVNWTKNGTEVSTNATYTFTVTEAGSYVAHFQYTPSGVIISATANPAIGGTITGAGSYNIGQSCTLTATAATGYTFVNWTKGGSVVSTNAAYTFTVTEAGDYVANFQINTYDITASANPTAGGTVSGAGTYNHGASCTLTATAATDYTFQNWTKGGSVVSTNASYTFTVTEAGAYVANFEYSPSAVTITATANPTAGGTITGAGSYNIGQSCTLTATAATGYTFVNWTKGGTVVSTNASYTFTVTEAGAYVANFQAVTYAITATANPTAGGTVAGAGTYNHGASCTLTATAATDYSFVSWTKGGTVVSTSATYTFTVTEAGAYVANFQYNPSGVAITATANPTDGGTVTGAGTYNIGQSCTLTATAATGYEFVNWTKGGTVVSTSASYTFTVAEAGAYVANFQVATYAITATANPTAGGTVTGAGTFNHGASCTLTATAATGYEFVNWTKGGTVVSTNASYTFTVTESASYVANFAVQGPVSYTIAATANPTDGGTVTGAGTYNIGQSCTLTATAATGYNFVNWTKDGILVSITPSYSFTVTESASYVANFEVQGPTTYTITATANPTVGGTISGAGNYDFGQLCTLTATPSSGYVFVNWTCDGNVVSSNATYSFPVTGDRSFVANFEVQGSTTYTITATANPTAGGTVSGAGTYNYGETCTLTVSLNTNYEFVSWTLNGAVVSEDETYTFVVTENRHYTANLKYVNGVEENSLVTTELYPNPATNTITVEASVPVELMEIYSYTGALVYRETTGADKATVDVSGLAPGTYTIRLVTSQGVANSKFVKIR